MKPGRIYQVNFADFVPGQSATYPAFIVGDLDETKANSLASAAFPDRVIESVTDMWGVDVALVIA